MKSEIIGQYQDKSTGKIYTVEKRTKQVSTNLLSGNSKIDGGHFYITSCGVHITPLDKDLNKFKLQQIDGIIERI